MACGKEAGIQREEGICTLNNDILSTLYILVLATTLQKFFGILHSVVCLKIFASSRLKTKIK